MYALLVVILDECTIPDKKLVQKVRPNNTYKLYCANVQSIYLLHKESE